MLWLKEKKLKIFYPNPIKMIYLWFNLPKVDIQSDEDITCYWVHSGTWGAYTPPNKIFVCPWDIDSAGGFERLIKHEINHLKFEKDVHDMSHEEKESYINYK